ncbi:MAG TPA: hypothetical protein ENJ38_01425 [Rhodospirillales bacterium]|nr:hypothetical protein [Rhodospirillales bacterium]
MGTELDEGADEGIGAARRYLAYVEGTGTAVQEKPSLRLAKQAEAVAETWPQGAQPSAFGTVLENDQGVEAGHGAAPAQAGTVMLVG